jgi:hypothetical protein
MATPETKEVVLEIPDIGLSDEQIHSLKEKFHSNLVTTLGEKAGVIVVVRIRVRVVRALE